MVISNDVSNHSSSIENLECGNRSDASAVGQNPILLIEHVDPDKSRLVIQELSELFVDWIEFPAMRAGMASGAIFRSG